MNDKHRLERRILQCIVLVAGCVPVFAGGSGMLFGVAMLGGHADLSLDSHFRYLSGLLFGIGIGFWSAIPALETKTERVRLLGAIVFIGGLARLGAAITVGLPSGPMILAIGMELVVTPLLCLWQGRMAAKRGQQTL